MSYNYAKVETYQHTDLAKYMYLAEDHLECGRGLVSLWEYNFPYTPDDCGLREFDMCEFQAEWAEGMVYLQDTCDLVKFTEEVANTGKLQECCVKFMEASNTKQDVWEPYEIVRFASDITTDLLLSLGHVPCFETPKRLQWLNSQLQE